MIVSAERLDLVPLSPALLRASLAGDRATAERLLGATLPADWPVIPEILALRLEQLEREPALEPWLLRAMILRSSGAFVGHIGFHTAPGPDYLREIAPGAVEFGFTVLEPYRRRGFAREASLALMRWAREEHDVAAFILTIGPSNAPSQALANQLGFTRIGSHIDEVDGEEDILILLPRGEAGSVLADG